MAHQFGHGVGVNAGVGVDGHDDVALRRLQRVRKRGGFAAVGLVNDAHARDGLEMLIQQFAGAVGRAVIDHDNFERPG